MVRIKKAIFPVGGLGTRFLPATKCIPKEMLPVANKPLIQYAFEEAQNAGIEQFIFVTGRNKTAINNHFDHSYELEEGLSSQAKIEELKLTRNWLPEAGKIVFIRQQHPLGLGHAILCAKDIVGEHPFAVILADELLRCRSGFLKEMIDSYENIRGNMVAVSQVELSLVSNYGIVKTDKQKQGVLEIKDMIEKPAIESAPSNLALIGRYILEPEIFRYLEQTPVGKNGEIQLTDAMKMMIQGSAKFYAKIFNGERFDCGNPSGLLKANIAMALENDEMAHGIEKFLKDYLATHKCLV